MTSEPADVEYNLFRARDDREAPVTPAELFFDLVFVFAVTQVSHFLLHHLTWLGALQAGFLLLAVWSSWVDTVLITNLLNPARQPVRVALLALMAVGLVLSAALPEAFGEGGLIFAIAFVVFQLGRTLFIAWATRSRPGYRRHFLRMAFWVVIYGAFWIAGGLVDGYMRIALWTVALALDYIMPAFSYPVPGFERARFTVLDINGAHIAERIGLFIMIALGESVLVTGAAFAELEWTPPVVLAMASSLLASMAMWWIYFYWSSDRAREVIAQAPDPSRYIIRAFGYVPWIVGAGIVMSAVGDELALAEPMEHAGGAPTLVIIGGTALFLLGAVLFEFGALAKWSRIRIAGLAATLLLLPFASGLSTLTLSLLTTAILVAVGAAEHVWLRSGRKGNATEPAG